LFGNRLNGNTKFKEGKTVVETFMVVIMTVVGTWGVTTERAYYPMADMVTCQEAVTNARIESLKPENADATFVLFCTNGMQATKAKKGK